MRIAYIAKHGQLRHTNDDEGAIADALTTLGHSVTCVHENSATTIPCGADMLLFHKWHGAPWLKWFKPAKVFWYFDLVDYPTDSTIATRCSMRKQWMRQVVPMVDLGFCTDGDWVAADKTGKLAWLLQGADQRNIDANAPYEQQLPLLFVGSIDRCGQERLTFFNEMRRIYRNGFLSFPRGFYGNALKDLIASCKIAVAPDGPVTDRYWSNRVYVMLGHGAFLLHPWCAELAKQYQDSKHLVYYRNRDHLHALVAQFLESSADRRRISNSGMIHTKQNHTYINRCRQLLDVVKSRLGVS